MKKNNDNLESFINVLIRMVESSESHNKEQIDTLKKSIDELQKTVNSVKTQMTDVRIKSAVNNATSLFKGNIRAKVLIAIVAFLTTASTIIIKFNNDIINYIVDLIK